MVLACIFQENGGFRSAKHEENIKATRFWNVSKIAFVFALSCTLKVQLFFYVNVILLSTYEMRFIEFHKTELVLQ